MGNFVPLNKMDWLKRQYIFRFNSDEEARDFSIIIHNQLVGNQDYIDNNIVINDHITRASIDPDDDTIGEVHVYIFDECEHIPVLTI